MSAGQGRIIDEAAREAIGRSGLKRTLFVDAGAGTGKTTELVSRICSLVLDAGVRLANIAAITFTKAAATELADRVRVAFEKREIESDDSTERARCRQAIADADLAAITTLHGFAKRIISEYPIEAGLPPRVDVLDEVSSQLAVQDRWEQFVNRLYDDPRNEELLIRAALLDIAFEPRFASHVTLKDIADRLTQNTDRLETIAGRQHAALEPIDFTPFDDAVATLAELPDACLERTDKFYLHLTEKLLPHMQAITAISDPNRKLRALRLVADDWGPGNGGRNGAWGGDVKAAKAHITTVNDALNAVVSAVAHDVLERIITAMSKEALDAAEARRLEGRLEFHDLLVLARKLLRTNENVRCTLNRRYTHLLLDEFQDTDPIQIELAVLIASALCGDDPPRWSDVSVEEGRLFFVGDPKQSIYRFRRADIGLYLTARDHFGPDRSWLKLTTNFRSVPAVLDWVNSLFDNLMAKEEPGRQPRYERLVAYRSPSLNSDHRCILLGGSRNSINSLELREIEAADVTRAIEEIRANPEAWPIYDTSSSEWRPARLADITILLPTRTSLPHLRSALERNTVPYRIDTGTLIYDTQEVHDAMAALRAIDDPTDELSLVKALRSPLYACSDIDLYTWRDAGGRWNLRRDPPSALSSTHPVTVAMAHLRSLWQKRWWTTPANLLHDLLCETQAFLLAIGAERPKEVWRHLRFLLDQARAFEEAEGGDLRAFLRWAELQQSGRSERTSVHEPLLPETDDDAVRILTIHGSKGLEFPITILSGMTASRKQSRSKLSLFWNDTGEPEVRLRKGITTRNHDSHTDIEAEMDRCEKLRLLYVACTRARDYLIVSCHHKTGDTSYAQCVWEHGRQDQNRFRILDNDSAMARKFATGPKAANATPATLRDDREAWIAAREVIVAPQRTNRFISATHIAQATLGIATSPTTLSTDRDTTADDWVDDAGGPLRTHRRGRAGTAIGRAAHATLQLTSITAPRDIEVQAARQARLEAIPELADTVAAMVRSALDSDAASLATQHTHHKELYVAAPIGDHVIEGYIDLLIETPDGLVIVDYKTDTVRSEAEIDAKLAVYELQGAAYALALETSTGMPVVDCRFVFCKPEGPIERTVANLNEAKRRVTQRASP